jgi:hypothetical protein
VALEQPDEIVRIGGDQLRRKVTDLVEHFDAIALDVGIFVPQVCGDFLDPLPVLRFYKLASKLLVGDLVPPLLQVGDLI